MMLGCLSLLLSHAGVGLKLISASFPIFVLATLLYLYELKNGKK